MRSRTAFGTGRSYSNSLLKNLPPERQREIYEHLQTHSMSKTKAWLAAAGMHASVTQLHVFYHWYPTAAALRAAGQVEQIVKEFMHEHPECKLTERQLSILAKTVCLALGIDLEEPRFMTALWKVQRAGRRR